VNQGAPYWFDRKIKGGKLVQDPTDKRYYISFHHGLINLPRECSIVIRQLVYTGNSFDKLIVNRVLLNCDSSDPRINNTYRLKLPSSYNWYSDLEGSAKQA
jgi:hypothetical protein